MMISTRKFTWTVIGFAVALLAGAPAAADDTELLLINPDPTQNPKPNVLFILDTSGSMDGEVSTINPYNSAETYETGDCDPNRMYWTDVDVEPVCDDSNNRYIEKSAFQCQYAANQIAGIGSFQNTMVQYRDGGKNGGGTGPARWQYLAPGYHTQPVECQADSGVHGDGRATYLWAANGTDLDDPFTNVEAGELSWGSAPRNISYTFYDGNYLNWKSSPETVTLTRLQVVQSVTSAVLSSVNNLNVGLMRFNDEQGGPVLKAMQDLDDNRAAILSAIDGLDHEGYTPLSETLYEAARYWRGMPAYFGESDPDELLAHESTTDGAALLSTEPDIYRRPTSNVCSKNYNVLLTDGEPRRDVDTPALAPLLPNFTTVLNRTACTDTEGTIGTEGDGHCLDDVAEYLSKEDIDPVMEGDQHVTTHTIGFAIDLPILDETASASGGEYFQANDVESLTKTLLEIIANINDRTLTFTAPAAAVNTFNRTQNLNDLYVATFGARAKVHWPGNIKKYRIANGQIVDKDGDPAVDPDTGFFSDESWSYWTSGSNDGNRVRAGGAANEIPDPADRKLFTNRSGTCLLYTSDAADDL